ncbi:hypothetical protein BDR03DRAFT_869152, partial [Suillus americanus]
VVSETLKLHAPVTWTMRVATKDDQISVTKPSLDSSGESRDVIKIRKHHHHTHSGYQQEGHGGNKHAYSFRHVPSCSILFSLTAHRDRPDCRTMAEPSQAS